MAEKKTAAKKPSTKAAPKGETAAAAAPEGPTCRHEKCKQPVRAKGYCRTHFRAWRRGAIGAKHRYNTCSKEGCRKKAEFAGRCAEHRKSGGAAAGGEEAAAAPA